MLDTTPRPNRELYQEVVNSTAQIRALGLEWLFLFTVDGSSNAETSTIDRRNELMGQLRQAVKMLESGVADRFPEITQSSQMELFDSMTATKDAVQETVAEFSRMEAEKDIRSLNYLALLVQAERHVEKCGNNLSRFLKLLNAVVSATEDQSKDKRVKFISSAITEIDKINTTINLIAVNASVEAARAGVAGRGFSVIAAEIQSLSQQSKTVFDNLQKQIGKK